MSRYLSDTELLELLVHSIRGDQTMEDVARALDPQLRRVSLTAPELLLWARLLQTAGVSTGGDLLPPLQRLTDAAGGLKNLPTAMLEWLSWQLHVDFRELATDDVTLARMVVRSIPWHRIKGTPASVRQALALFGYNVRLEEDGTGDYWATYQMELQSALPRANLAHIWAIADEMQPARCKLWRMYNSEYDWRPGTWSGGGCRQAPGIPAEDSLWRHCWSYFWWSYYSGAPVPGIPGVDDAHDLIVSFGQRDGYEAEPYLTEAMHAAWGMVQQHGFRIPYVDHAFWSWSNWSELYRLQAAFITGQLYSALVGDWIYEGPDWHSDGWDERIWGHRYVGYRREPWTMGWYGWAKAQQIFSEPWRDPANNNYGGAYGDINSNYSLPVWYYLDGDAPEWSRYLWSDEEQRAKMRVILEQFREVAGLQANREQLLAAAGCAREDVLTSLSVYPDHPIWGRFCYSDAWPQRHGFARADLLAAAAGEEIREQLPWDGSWDDRLWGRLDGIERHQDDWQIHVGDESRHQLAASQLVYAEPHDDGSKWGDINSNYSRPVVTEYPAPPAYSAFAWSDNVCEITHTPIDRQYTASFAATAAPYAFDGQGGFAQVREYSALAEQLWLRGWQQGWDGRRWQHPAIYSSITASGSAWDLHYILHALAPGATIVPAELPVSNYPDLHSVLTGLMEGVTLCHVFDASDMQDVVTRKQGAAT